jgi:hypothetical protein
MSKRRQYRRREASDEETEADDDHEKPAEEDGTVSKVLDEMREMQKYRKRPAGVSAVGLAFGKKFTEEESIAVSGTALCFNARYIFPSQFSQILSS